VFRCFLSPSLLNSVSKGFELLPEVVRIIGDSFHEAGGDPLCFNISREIVVSGSEASDLVFEGSILA
jgi:hypothetical protein